MARLRAVLVGLGWALLGLAALAGLALSAAVLFARSELGRPFVASTLVRFADEALAGGLKLEGIEVLPGGGVAVRGLRVTDPHGHLVLAVDRARVFADVTRLRNRSIGLTAEVEGASVLLEEEPGGGISLARAFASSRPSAPRHPGRVEAAPAAAGGGWTVRFERVTLRRSDVWWVSADGATRLEAQALDVDARGVLGPGRVRAELRLAGALDLPISAPLSLEIRGALDGKALRVGVLRAKLGDTSVEGLGEVELGSWRGRVALGRLRVDRGEARVFVPQAGLGSDLDATAYLESDGAVATGAVRVAPADGAAAPAAERGGGADAAVALRMDGTPRAMGADVAVDHLDPSRLHFRAPRGEVTLTARGGAAGDALETLRGRLAVSLSRSRLRGAELGPGELAARAEAGRWEVQRLALSAPGLSARGSGTWRRRGEVSGKVALDASDLGRALRNAGTLLGARLPPLGGRVKLDGAISGTARQPVVDARIEAPLLEVGGTAFVAVRGESRSSGPLRDPTARVELSAARLRQGGHDVARALLVRGTVTAVEARLDASADVPALGRDPVTLRAVAERTARASEVVLTELTIGYPGTRYALEGRTRLALSGPRVDRLALAAGAQRITVTGGIGRRDALDARVLLEQVRLEGLPAGLLPGDERIAGAVSADLDARGTTGRPVVSGRFSVAGGRWRTLEALQAMGEVRWDGRARRATASATVARAAGGTAEVALDLPVPLALRPREPVSARVRAEALPLEALLAAARVEVPAGGALSLEATLSGVAGAPALEAEATLADARYQDLSSLGLTVSAEAPGERLAIRAEARLSGARAARAELEVPLELSDLLARPAETLRAVRRAPVQGGADVPGLDLALVAGRLGLPDGLAGRLVADVRLDGSLAAPRGTAGVELRDATVEGYAGVAARVSLTAGPERVSVAAEASLRGAEVLRATGSLGAPPERLTTPAELRRAPLALEAVVPRVALASTSTAALLVEGTVEGRLTAEGTLGAPRLALTVDGKRVAIQGRPLGEVAVRARWASRATADLSLVPVAGGALEATLAVELPASIDLRAAAVRAAPAQLALRARALGLGFLPAAAPGTIREASGTLEADVSARGPLARLTPRGTVRVTDGRVAVSEYGDWSDIQVDATVTQDSVEIARLSARRGRGTLEARASLRGLAHDRGTLQGQITTRELSIMRAGMTLATLDLQIDLTGGYRSGQLEAQLRLPRGTVRLPKRAPRTLQSLERRKDIVVGRRPERRERARPAGPAGPPGPAERPLQIRVRVVAPGRLMVVSDNPRTRIELKADVTFELRDSEQYATGTVEVVRGDVEPIGGRNFQIEHAKVTFTGGPPAAALLDVEAVYEHPTATVTAVITGPLRSPDFRLTSEPPMEEAQIAMLIATGTAELKPGGGGVGTLTGEEAGKAALGALATQMFKNLVADKLPLDTVALESGAIRAGKYVTDRVYVGYTRRFEAQPDKAENLNEVRVEYQITPHWTFESRYGDAQSGGASLIWSKNY